MANLILPRRFTQQPQYPVEVDHNNPLAEGIQFALDPVSFSRDVSGRNVAVTVSGTLSRTATTKGIGLSGFASGYLSFPEPITQSSGATIFAVLQNASTGDQGLWTTGQAAQQDHWPYAGVAYLSALAASRWVSGVSIPGNLLAPHSISITRTAGSGSVNFVAYKDGVSFATGTPFPNSVTTTWNIGRNSGTNLRYGGAVLAFYAFDRTLNEAEVHELNANPWQIFRAHPRVLYFDVGGGGGATLLPPIYTDDDTFHAATVTPGTVTLTPALVSDGDTFHAATITQGGAAQELTPALFADDDTFHAATVAAGTVTLAPGLLSDGDTFHAPTVAPGAVTLTPALLTDGDTFHAATVVLEGGPQTLLPDLFTDGDTFHAATVTPGAVNLAPTLYTDADTFHAAEIASGFNLQPEAYADPDTFYPATVAPGAVTLAPDLLADGDTFYPAALSWGQQLLADLVVDADVFYAHAVIEGVITDPLTVECLTAPTRTTLTTAPTRTTLIESRHAIHR